MKNKTYNRKKIMVVFVCAMLVLAWTDWETCISDDI